MSHITTHILDTSLGKPAEGVQIDLLEFRDGNWKIISTGTTNSDGRISDLLSEGKKLSPGIYKMYFNTGKYFQAKSQKSFYPFVEVIFETFDQSHYHIPLLLNPFGYSTYRGS